MALTVENAIQAIIDKAGTLAPTALAEDLVYLAKSLEAVSDSTLAADAAAQTVIERVNTLSPSASPEDLIYLAKAVEALAIAATIGDVTDEGTTQVSRVTSEGTTQVDRVISEGDTQHSRVVDEGDAQVARVAAVLPDALDSKAEAAHNHDASEITSGTLPSARLPNASSTNVGGVKIRLNGTTAYITSNGSNA